MNADHEHTRSLWMNVAALPDAPRLEGQLTADVAIVGSGMAGLSAARELAAVGRKVVVIDRGTIAGGMTSRTTAHLSPICDDRISNLIDLRGEELAQRFQQSQEAAIDRIQLTVQDLDIDCDFRRLDGFLFPAPDMAREDAEKQVEKELAAARSVGAAAERATGMPFKGLEDAPALRYAAQATFHPLKYLRAIAGDVAAKDGRLFADSPVERIEASKQGVEVHLQNGARIAAEHAIVATNSPVHKRVELHSKMAPYRTYAMAFAIPRDALPDALYWDMADPYHYVRLDVGRDGIQHLIVGGEDHKSGEADDGNVRFAKLEAWIRRLVPGLGREVHRWSGQVMNTLDHCGYIGRDPDSERLFVATGDSGQGMTHGALAGLLLRDLIVSGASPWEAVYDPARKTLRAAGTYVRENVTAVRNFAEYLLPGQIASVEKLQPGQGGILRDGVKRLAACRDLEGTVHVRSAVCTHLGCHVAWNSTEQCWDCPCHGSQFAPDGAVLNGPAVSPLHEVEAPADKERK